MRARLGPWWTACSPCAKSVVRHHWTKYELWFDFEDWAKHYAVGMAVYTVTHALASLAAAISVIEFVGGNAAGGTGAAAIAITLHIGGLYVLIDEADVRKYGSIVSSDKFRDGAPVYGLFVPVEDENWAYEKLYHWPCGAVDRCLPVGPPGGSDAGEGGAKPAEWGGRTGEYMAGKFYRWPGSKYARTDETKRTGGDKKERPPNASKSPPGDPKDGHLPPEALK